MAKPAHALDGGIPLLFQMRVDTLRAFDGIAFGSSAAVLDARGKPTQPRVNAKGEAEYWFAELVFRFVADKLVEVSFKTPRELEIDGEMVASALCWAFSRTETQSFLKPSDLP